MKTCPHSHNLIHNSPTLGPTQVSTRWSVTKCDLHTQWKTTWQERNNTDYSQSPVLSERSLFMWNSRKSTTTVTDSKSDVAGPRGSGRGPHKGTCCVMTVWRVYSSTHLSKCKEQCIWNWHILLCVNFITVKLTQKLISVLWNVKQLSYKIKQKNIFMSIVIKIS